MLTSTIAARPNPIPRKTFTDGTFPNIRSQEIGTIAAVNAEIDATTDIGPLAKHL